MATNQTFATINFAYCFCIILSINLFNCSDKARLIKTKRSLDGKRNDRKNFRSGMKIRYDTFSSKMGFPGIDSTFAGNNLLGMQ